MSTKFVCVLLAVAASASAAPGCDAGGDADTIALRNRAAELYEAGDYVVADACISAALVKATEVLEILATQAKALKDFREARLRAPTVAPNGHGCVVDAIGKSICLPALASPSSTSSQPSTAAECGDETTALQVLRAQFGPDSTTEMASNALASDSEPDAPTPIDAFIVQSVQRHWWAAAKNAVDVLRAQNMPPGADTRRAVTEIRDEAGSLLALMRQTKMDEATINCAVMWAQGLYSVHLNVKFAARLDAPVTVLNVDNEVVHLGENRITFSGIGRQKPKRYVVDLELFAPIVANESTWSFGSVGTLKFVLKKQNDTHWERLTASNESVKNHRIWWEKQEQVEKADREMSEEKARKARQEREQKQQAEREEREKLAEQEKVERRAAQMPHLLAATTAVDALTSTDITEDVASRGAELTPLRDAANTAVDALLNATGQGGNETAKQAAEESISKIVQLRSTGFESLTKEAMDKAIAGLKVMLESHVEPMPPSAARPPVKKQKSGKKKKKTAKKAQ